MVGITAVGLAVSLAVSVAARAAMVWPADASTCANVSTIPRLSSFHCRVGGLGISRSTDTESVVSIWTQQICLISITPPWHFWLLLLLESSNDSALSLPKLSPHDSFGFICCGAKAYGNPSIPSIMLFPLSAIADFLLKHNVLLSSRTRLVRTQSFFRRQHRSDEVYELLGRLV